jgi:hypothetical protein
MGQLLRLAVDRDCCMYKGKPDPTYRQKALSLVILILFYYILKIYMRLLRVTRRQAIITSGNFN